MDRGGLQATDYGVSKESSVTEKLNNSKDNLAILLVLK